ncbi:MAG: M81 family metallopeptidase [Anaerolineales bacterium]|nr:M81 family metallopeptidase [Anaerolineales bacterium]
MRIAIAGFSHETNTFSTLPTRFEDFYVVRGEQLTQDPLWQAAAAQGHQIMPLLVASASPSGRVTRSAFERFSSEVLDGLRQCMPLDGVLLHLHGAMEVEEIGDGETALLKAVRALVGADPLIAVTLDLHANLAQAVVDCCNLVTAYRTAPHRDIAETRARGGRLLLHCLEAGVRPSTQLIKLPLLVAGEAAVTEVEPARSLYARLPAIDERDGILASSILIGCAWTDSPETTVSVAVSGTDVPASRAAATELAQAVWDARRAFSIDVPTASMADAIQMAYASPIRPVFISDSGDNPTAGAAGDSPLFLEQLVLSKTEEALVAGITDPAAVEVCFRAGAGACMTLSLGGKLDQAFAQPYQTETTVERLVPETNGIPPRAVVQIDGVTAVVQSDRPPFTELRHFESAGIDLSAWKVVVVKLGYLFPELRDFAPQHIMALSPGFGDQCIERLPYQHVRRPIFPLEPEVRWQPEPAGQSTEEAHE